MTNKHTNIFSALFSKINLRNHKVLIGIAVVLALAIVALIMSEDNAVGNSDESSEKDAVSALNEKMQEETEELEIIDTPASEKVETVEAAAEAPEEAPEEAAPTAEAVAEEAAPAPQPVFKSDSEIKREIDEETSIDDSNAVYSMAAIEQMPQFPGGDAALYQFIANNISYPADAQEEGVQGRVIVKFTVTKTGSITDVSVVRSRHPSLDREAIRVIKSMPRWIPGKQKGRPVNVVYSLPVSFSLK